jgi:hypothetical protein
MLAAITATDGRPEAFGLLTQWMRLQRYGGPLAWVIAGSDLAGYDLDAAGAVARERGWRFAVSVAGAARRHEDAMVRNLRVAFSHAFLEDATAILFCEDDDYYAPDFITRYADALERAPLVGAPRARYYNVVTRRWRQMANAEHASLAQTGVRREAFDHVRELIETRPQSLQADRYVWRYWQWPRGGQVELNEALSGLHVSVKGLPGTPGYGVGHRDAFGQPDDGLRVFRDWGLPDAYLAYGASHDDQSGG